MRKFLFIFIFIFILSGCDQKPPTNSDGNSTDDSLVQSASGDYSIKAPLKPSPIRGVSLNTDSYIDYDLMETDLLEITKEFMTPTNYFYKPGQVLTTDDVNVLLERESDDNAHGLNPAIGESKKDNPIYVNTIVEQDFYTVDSKGKEDLKTISLGFGIDTTYNYEKDKEVVISDEQIKGYITQYVTEKVVNYIRKEKGLEDVNVICAFYKEPEDSTLPGKYYTYGQMKVDDKKLKEIETKDIEYKAYPDYTSKDPINQDIIEFTNKIDKYFSNFNGVSAIGKLENGKLKELNIKVIVSLYSEIELKALNSYIENNLTQSILGVDHVIITIELPTGEAISIREYNKGKLNIEYIK